jgi:hypothetical protein
MSPTGTVEILTRLDPIDNQSLAHGWATGPTAQMSEFVLGVSPVEPGYATWMVAPRLGDLRWAKGQVPTAFGPFWLSWRQDRHGKRLRGEVAAPPGTQGEIVLPPAGEGAVVYFDGRRVPAGEPIAITGGERRHRIRMTAD